MGRGATSLSTSRGGAPPAGFPPLGGDAGRGWGRGGPAGGGELGEAARGRVAALCGGPLFPKGGLGGNPGEGGGVEGFAGLSLFWLTIEA